MAKIHSNPLWICEASKHPHWRQAMQEELNAHLNTGTWSLVPSSPSHNLVGCNTRPFGDSLASDSIGTSNLSEFSTRPFGNSPASDSIGTLKLIYVDDILVTGPSPQACKQVIQLLSALFPIKDLGSLHYFLSIKVKRSSKNLLQNVKMDGAKPCVTPLSTSKLDHDSPLLDNPIEYRSLVGALQYLTWTRLESLDLSFAVNFVCQFMHCLKVSHLQAVKKILRYLKRSIDLGLRFSKCSSIPTISMAKNPIFHARTKHVEIDYHCISEKVLVQEISGHFVCSQDQVVDVYTKALSKSRFIFLRDKLALRHPQFSLRGDIKGKNVNDIV
uniref:T2.10 protein n=1 Tax=Malus x robusta TaxID=1184610 RepID=I7JQ49_9ROSA|nr:T2.10 [Malus x robusta]